MESSLICIKLIIADDDGKCWCSFAGFFVFLSRVYWPCIAPFGSIAVKSGGREVVVAFETLLKWSTDNINPRRLAFQDVLVFGQ